MTLTFTPLRCSCGRIASIGEGEGDGSGPDDPHHCDECGTACGVECCNYHWAVHSEIRVGLAALEDRDEEPPA